MWEVKAISRGFRAMTPKQGEWLQEIPGITSEFFVQN